MTKTGRWKIISILRSRNASSFYILFLVFAFCTLFYYFGELVNFAGWEALRWEFFYGVHDIHRLLFLAPIIYAAYVFGARATITMTILTLAAFLPRAFFISPYPDPLLRMLLFTVIAGVLGYLTARTVSEAEQRSRLQAQLTSDRDTLLRIMERMQDGVIIIGPDYRVRLMNQSMKRDFGEGVGPYCYERIRKLNAPCQTCPLPKVISGANERWEYTFPDGRTYEVLASPYIDADGTVCQLATFRNITSRKRS